MRALNSIIGLDWKGGDAMPRRLKVYLIGSLRNPKIPEIGNRIRALGFEVFDDWFAAGPEADDKWRDYEKARGRTFREALQGLAADHVFRFDLEHLDECDIAVLYLPAGKSGHIELGYVIGRGKRGYIVLDNPERWDVMYKFADGVFDNIEELEEELKKVKRLEENTENLFGNGLVLASTSRHKLEATRMALNRLRIQTNIFPVAVESGINLQPFGLEEITLGALNRARDAKNKMPGFPALAVENGIIKVSSKFIDLAVCALVLPDEKVMLSTSGGIEIPKDAVKLAESQGFDKITVGKVISDKFGGLATDPHSTLTAGKISRKELIAEAISIVLSQAILQLQNHEE